MKFNLHYRNHQSSPTFTALVREEIESIGKTRQIDEAHVLVDYRFEGSPAFRITAHLVTPGPDLFAEASEHTRRAALHKVIAQIETELSRRSLKRSRNLRSGTSKPQAQVHSAHA